MHAFIRTESKTLQYLYVVGLFEGYDIATNVPISTVHELNGRLQIRLPSSTCRCGIEDCQIVNPMTVVFGAGFLSFERMVRFFTTSGDGFQQVGPGQIGIRCSMCGVLVTLVDEKDVYGEVWLEHTMRCRGMQ